MHLTNILGSTSSACDCFSNWNSPPELGAARGLRSMRKNNCSALCWGYQITGATTRSFICSLIMIRENKGHVNRADIVSPAFSMTWWCSASEERPFPGDSVREAESPFSAHPAHPALCRLAVWALFLWSCCGGLPAVIACSSRSLYSVTPRFPPVPSLLPG